MEQGFLFYFILGASVVGVPAITDYLLKRRAPQRVRVAIGFAAAVAAALVVVLVGKSLNT